MARKKQEIQLQTELETQEEYEDMLSKEGLIGNRVWLQDDQPQPTTTDRPRCTGYSTNFDD